MDNHREKESQGAWRRFWGSVGAEGQRAVANRGNAAKMGKDFQRAGVNAWEGKRKYFRSCTYIISIDKES